VHFARNLLANIPKGHQEMVAAAFRTIFAQVSPEETAAQWDHVEAMLTERFDKAAALMRRAKEEVLAFRTFPRAHWRQIWSANPLERLNKEVKRHSRVVGIFPNEAAAIRLLAPWCSTSTTSGPQPNGATSPKALWQVCTHRAMMRTRRPRSSRSLSDRHRG
jgi:transposase-like protein